MPAPVLPTEVERTITDLVGGTGEREPLGGLSGRLVLAVHGQRRTIVVKGPVGHAEAAVAGPLGGALREHGVPAPTPLAIVGTADHATWLVLEHLPDPLPRHRWGADPETVSLLRNLHAVPTSSLDTLIDRYQPRWTAETTEAAARLLQLRGSEAAAVNALQDRWTSLTPAARLISGDPNPLNWRLGGQGEPVLLDWERITVASPALDLAILLPGLPGRGQAGEVVREYERAGGERVAADDVLLAKAFTVIELAAGATPGTPASDVVRGVATEFAAWVRTELH